MFIYYVIMLYSKLNVISFESIYIKNIHLYHEVISSSLYLLIIICHGLIQKLTVVTTTLPPPTVKNVGDENSKGMKLINVIQVNKCHHNK